MTIIYASKEKSCLILEKYDDGSVEISQTCKDDASLNHEVDSSD